MEARTAFVKAARRNSARQILAPAHSPAYPYTPMLNLTGQRIFIAGGSRGIGRAAALLAAEAGADLAIGYARDQAAADAVVQKIRSLGRQAIALKADVTDEAAMKNAVDRAAATLGGLDGLVVSAGVFEGEAIETMSLDLWNRVLATNLTGTFLTVKAAVPHLKRTGRGGSIVIYTSTAGQRGSDIYSAYATSKGGQIMFMRSMARELAPARIRVNCVAPAWTETDMAHDSLDRIGRDKIIAGFPLGRIGQPADIAGATLYLLSPLAEFVTGMTLTVDGGMDMRG